MFNSLADVVFTTHKVYSLALLSLAATLITYGFRKLSGVQGLPWLVPILAILTGVLLLFSNDLLPFAR